MIAADRPPANPLVAYARRVYRPLGFSKGYNFILWFLAGGALAGFALARFIYLDFDGVFCGDGPGGAAPGECYYYCQTVQRVGILMHLAGILPAGLAVFQFLPVIRHKVLLVHRISGYVVLLLSTVGVAGLYMAMRHGLGGAVDIQSAAGLGGIIFVVCKAITLYNIKMLQIEQHRAWMLRAWVIAGFIITMRILGFIMANIIGKPGGEYYVVEPCYVVDMFGHNQTATEALHPACRTWYSGANPNVRVAIHGDLTSGHPDEAVSAFNSSWGTCGFLALFLHTLAGELYLRLTPAEAERLRRVSYQRQVEAGMKNPGNSGLTVERFGDSDPWFPHQSVPRAPGDTVLDKVDMETPEMPTSDS